MCHLFNVLTTLTTLSFGSDTYLSCSQYCTSPASASSHLLPPTLLPIWAATSERWISRPAAACLHHLRPVRRPIVPNFLLCFQLLRVDLSVMHTSPSFFSPTSDLPRFGVLLPPASHVLSLTFDLLPYFLFGQRRASAGSHDRLLLVFIIRAYRTSEQHKLMYFFSIQNGLRDERCNYGCCLPSPVDHF